jgi:uncharacterized protein
MGTAAASRFKGPDSEGSKIPSVDPAALAVGRETAIRFLLEAQGLHGRLPARPTHAAGPAAVLRHVRRLECVQIDPVAAVERNQHLVLAARVPGYRPSDLETLLGRGLVFEYMANAACVIPIEDYPIFEGTRRRYRRRYGSELTTLRGVVRGIVADLERHGPRTARAFVSDHRVRGWWDTDAPKTKATSFALNMLLRTGALTVVRRDGLERTFDLAERVVPAPTLRAAARITAADADDALLEKYLRAYRLFDADDPRFGWRSMGAAARRMAILRRVRAGTVVPVTIDGIRRRYYVRATDADALRRYERSRRAGDADGAIVRFLPPLDNLLWRRERVADLFTFEYRWEVYLPEAKRRYGYYTMPILYGSRLIGRMDPRLDRERGRLEIRRLALEPGIRATRLLRRSLRAGLEAFASFHGTRDLRIEAADAYA